MTAKQGKRPSEHSTKLPPHLKEINVEPVITIRI